MIKIAIVDDEPEQSRHLTELMKRYEKEHDIAFEITVFENPLEFLNAYDPSYDMVFLDVMMPQLNGIDTARVLREKDSQVLLYFITTARQYAINGYEVEALDYIIKPLSYKEFQLKIQKGLNRLQKEDSYTILLKQTTGFVRLKPAEITYVEVSGHFCTYHTQTGEHRLYDTMKNAEEKLKGKGFAKCNSFLLVNLAFVEAVDKLTVKVNGTELPISYPKRKSFLEEFHKYTAGLSGKA
ncbi:MAG: response regulator transcription factor [Lachnospiraceae bacterium]|nr:response regulator transcription factor [Lachnospiraceae bacterium]